MRQSILVLLLASMATAFGAGCATTTLPDVAAFQFEPRVYPYVPEITPEGKNLPDPVSGTSK